MDPASVTQALKEACSIVDDVLPLEEFGRGKSAADRTQLRSVSLPVVLSALLADMEPDQGTDSGDDDLIPTKEAAEMLKVGMPAVIGYRERGLLRGTKTVRGQWRFRRGDVRTFQLPPPGRGRPECEPVSTGDIVRMKDAEGLSYREIVMRTGLSRSLVTARYRGWKAAQEAGGASPAEQPDGPAGDGG